MPRFFARMSQTVRQQLPVWYDDAAATRGHQRRARRVAGRCAPWSSAALHVGRSTERIPIGKVERHEEADARRRHRDIDNRRRLGRSRVAIALIRMPVARRHGGHERARGAGVRAAALALSGVGEAPPPTRRERRSDASGATRSVVGGPCLRYAQTVRFRLGHAACGCMKEHAPTESA
jgi:hypothetical protein